jgi:hypothetical protein
LRDVITAFEGHTFYMANKFDFLKQLSIEAQVKAYPNYPKHYLVAPKYSDKTANGLERCVQDYLKFSNWQCERIKNQGRRIDNTKIVTNIVGQVKRIGSVKFVPGTGTNGTADLKSCIKGRNVAWEVKIGKDVMSPAQIKYKADLEAAGGYYFVIKTFEDFLEKYEELIKCLK